MSPATAPAATWAIAPASTARSRWGRTPPVTGWNSSSPRPKRCSTRKRSTATRRTPPCSEAVAFSAARRRVGRAGPIVLVPLVALVVLAAIALLGVGLAGPVGAQGLTADDLVELKRLSEPAVAPDRSAVAYTLRETDREADRGRSDIWLLALGADDAKPRRLTNHPENDSAPAWSPDGERLYFLSSRSGSSQVWMMPLDFGEPLPVTDYPVPVS